MTCPASNSEILTPHYGKTMSLMVSISGIRGIVGQSLTPQVAISYAAGFASYVRQSGAERPVVVVGWDGRVTGYALARLVTSTLLWAGVDVVDVGIAPTPTVQLAVERLHAAGGIALTASHNPMQWNGLKFVSPTGMFLDAAENRVLWDLVASEQKYVAWDGIGKRTEDEGWIQKHLQAVLTHPYLDVPVVRRRKLRVVLDCVNACGGRIMPSLLRELGCDVIEMFCDVSGVFAHTPEPIPENLTALAERVKKKKADLGMAVDPDGDRLVLITEKGEPYIEEYTIASAVRFVLGREAQRSPGKPQTVVTNLSTTRAVEDIARQYNANVVRTPVGEINVAKKMKEVGAVIGGEGSGGVILPSVHLGRDAMVGTGLILQLLAESGGTLSELRQSLPQYFIAKGKIALRGTPPDDVLRRIHDAHARDGKVTTADGVKIDFPDHWVHLRKSNTEPIVRIIAEAHTSQEASALVEQFTAEILASP
jgi:phosphomannomutase